MKKIEAEKNSYSLTNLVITSLFSLGAGLFFGFFVLAVGLLFGAFIALVFAAGITPKSDDIAKLFILLIILFFIGIAIGGYIGYQQSQINALQANTITKAPLSTYQGIVQAIYNSHKLNNPSYIKFTNGNTYYGNLSKVSNLSAGEVCTLELNESLFSNDGFINGTCKVS